MIEVKDVYKSFSDVNALDGASLKVPRGSVYGLIGPNGAGKTTLLKVLSGVYKRDKGEATILGGDVYENPKVKNDIVFISDDLFFFTTYSILDTAKFYAGIYESFNWTAFEELNDVFKMDLNKKVRKLSKGMQKQVAFWIGLSCCPKVLLLDEPVDGLDPVMRKNVWRIIINAVTKRGMTVLISSHNLRELEDVCDHVGIMYKGKVVLEKSLDDAKSNIHKIQAVFKGDFPKDLGIEILHKEKFGSVNILIVKGDIDEITKKLSEYDTSVLDVLPLSLEEVFIYELGGMGYEIENIIQ